MANCQVIFVKETDAVGHGQLDVVRIRKNFTKTGFNLCRRFKSRQAFFFLGIGSNEDFHGNLREMESNLITGKWRVRQL